MEKQIKNIEVLLCYPIHFYLGNATFLFRQKKEMLNQSLGGDSGQYDQDILTKMEPVVVQVSVFMDIRYSSGNTFENMIRSFYTHPDIKQDEYDNIQFVVDHIKQTDHLLSQAEKRRQEEEEAERKRQQEEAIERRIQQALDVLRSELDAEHDQALQQKDRQHEQALHQLQTEHEQDKQQALQRKDREHEQALNAQKSRLDAEHDQDKQQALQQKDRQHKQTLHQLQFEHDQALHQQETQFQQKIADMKSQYERDFPSKVEAYLAERKRQEEEQQEKEMLQVNIYQFLEENGCSGMLEELKEEEEGAFSYKDLLGDQGEEEMTKYLAKACKILKGQARELATLFHTLFQHQIPSPLSYQAYLNKKAALQTDTETKQEETKQEEVFSLPDIQLNGSFYFQEGVVLKGYSNVAHKEAVLKAKEAEHTGDLQRELVNMKLALTNFHEKKRELENKDWKTQEDEQDLATPEAIVRMISSEVAEKAVNGHDYAMIVMEDGGTNLEEFLRLHPEFNLFDRISLCLQASQVLSFLRMANMVHLDLKPSNLLVTQREEILCIDGEAMTEEGQSVEGSVVFSADYAAPELLK